MHWTDDYYGALYLDSVADLLTPGLTRLEAEVICRLLALSPAHRVLDLACGHGRHAWALASAAQAGGGGPEQALSRAGRPGPDRGGRRAALRAGRPASAPVPARRLRRRAYSWYSSLFMYDEAGNAAALAELARVSGARRAGAGAPRQPAAARALPRARRLAGSCPTGRWWWRRRSSTRPPGWSGRTGGSAGRTGPSSAGTALLRYYRPDEWSALARRAGLRILALTSTTAAVAGAAGAPGPEAPDLIAVLERT